MFPKDTIVIRIEEEDYQSSLKQSQASTESNRAELNEIKVNIQNTCVELNLVKAKLELTTKNYNRIKQLLKKRLISQSSADAKYTEVHRLQQEVQNLSRRLNTLPQQQRNLNRTTISLPFNARISKLFG